jgi:hypothetical protein
MKTKFEGKSDTVQDAGPVVDLPRTHMSIVSKEERNLKLLDFGSTNDEPEMLQRDGKEGVRGGPRLVLILPRKCDGRDG